jgi:excisionase family DNA binding protein
MTTLPSMSQPDATYLGTREVAKLTGLSESTITRAADRGDLPIALVTPGGHRRFRREDIDRFLAGLGAEDRSAS